MNKREKAELFADLLAQVIQQGITINRHDRLALAIPPTVAHRTMTSSGSEMIVTEFEGQKINITITAARS